MRRIFLRLLVLLAFSSFMGGCGSSTGGTETGNTTAVSIRVIGYQSSQLAALDLPALTVGALEVDTAFVVLDRLRFRPLSACQDGAEDEGAEEFELGGPFVVDLQNPGAISGLEEVSIPTGRYCRIDLVLKKLEGTLPAGIDPSDPIVNRSILVEGRRQDGIPFQMTTEIDEEFELTNEVTGFSIESSSNSQVFFLGFDLDQWFNGVDLMDTFIEVSSGGGGEPIILINDTKNQNVQELIEENIKHSSDLFEDSDDNGSLDPEEEDNPLAIGTSVP
jgi:uncharacterized protein YceK